MDRPLQMGEADDIIGSDAGEETREGARAASRGADAGARVSRDQSAPARAQDARADGPGLLAARLGRARRAHGNGRALAPAGDDDASNDACARGESGACAGRNDAQDHRRVRPCRFRESRHRGVDAPPPRSGERTARAARTATRRVAEARRDSRRRRLKAPPRAVRLPAPSSSGFRRRSKPPTRARGTLTSRRGIAS